jgi:hypothetical protein
MDLVARAIGIQQWPARPADPVMRVHLPDGAAVTRQADEAWWVERRAVFGRAGESFWRWQERTADAMWSLALLIACAFSWMPDY